MREKNSDNLKMKLNTPVRQDAVRFVCMACLHQSFPDPQSVPPGDVLIVAGDFTLCGRPDEVELFNTYASNSFSFQIFPLNANLKFNLARIPQFALYKVEPLSRFSIQGLGKVFPG